MVINVASIPKSSKKKKNLNYIDETGKLVEVPNTNGLMLPTPGTLVPNPEPLPEVPNYPADIPRLPTGEVNPAYIPGSILKTNPKPEGEGIVETSTGGMVETLGKTKREGTPLNVRTEQQAASGAAIRAEQITNAFSQALGRPLPSLFDQSRLNTNWAGVGSAIEREAGTAAIGGGAAVLAGGTAIALGASTGGIGLAALGAGYLIKGVADAALKEYLGQKSDSMEAAIAKYNKGLELETQLLLKARRGGNPNEIITAYMILEQEKRTAIDILEYKSLNDASGFADKARTALNNAKFQEQPNIRQLREQALLDAMVNPTRTQEDLTAESPGVFG